MRDMLDLIKILLTLDLVAAGCAGWGLVLLTTRMPYLILSTTFCRNTSITVISDHAIVIQLHKKMSTAAIIGQGENISLANGESMSQKPLTS